MRGPFDRAIDLYFGPGTATPGVLIAGAVPARLVKDDVFADLDNPLAGGQYYLTLDEVLPQGPLWVNTAGHTWSVDFDQADEIALTPGGPVSHYIQRVELRTWPVGVDYFRAHIAPLDPLPPDVKVCVSIYGVNNLDTAHDPFAVEKVDTDGTITDTFTLLPTFIGVNDHGHRIVTIQVLRNGVVAGASVLQYHETPEPVIILVTEGVCTP